MRFYHKGLEMDVPDSVYYPREDSLLMAGVLEKEKAENCLEIGCGSGFLSILAAKTSAVTDVTAVDINEKAVEATKKNAKKNNVKLKAFVSDLFSSINDSYDLIVFNSPYLPTQTDDQVSSGKFEDKQWSGGIKVIEKFIQQAKNHLNKNGKILLLISSLTGEKEVLELFHNNNFNVRVIARERVPWEELMVVEAVPDKFKYVV